jgi:hypothetical protein
MGFAKSAAPGGLGWRALQLKGEILLQIRCRSDNERSTIQFLVAVCGKQRCRLGLDRTGALPVIGAVRGNTSSVLRVGRGRAAI